MTQRKPLGLGRRKALIFDSALDSDYELNVELENCDYGHDLWLSVAELIALRDHIDSILEERKPDCSYCQWPARVGHHADCPYRTDFSK